MFAGLYHNKIYSGVSEPRWVGNLSSPLVWLLACTIICYQFAYFCGRVKQSFGCVCVCGGGCLCVIVLCVRTMVNSEQNDLYRTCLACGFTVAISVSSLQIRSYRQCQ